MAAALAPSQPLPHQLSTLHTPQDGINAQWQAFYFSNAKYPLKSVSLNGKELERNEFQVRLAAVRVVREAGWGGARDRLLVYSLLLAVEAALLATACKLRAVQSIN
jgi:hypothetical protein